MKLYSINKEFTRFKQELIIILYKKDNNETKIIKFIHIKYQQQQQQQKGNLFTKAKILENILNNIYLYFLYIKKKK